MAATAGDLARTKGVLYGIGVGKRTESDIKVGRRIL